MSYFVADGRTVRVKSVGFATRSALPAYRTPYPGLRYGVIGGGGTQGHSAISLPASAIAVGGWRDDGG